MIFTDEKKWNLIRNDGYVSTWVQNHAQYRREEVQFLRGSLMTWEVISAQTLQNLYLSMYSQLVKVLESGGKRTCRNFQKFAKVQAIEKFEACSVTVMADAQQTKSGQMSKPSLKQKATQELNYHAFLYSHQDFQ